MANARDEPPPFTRLYLDSEPLRAAQWPHESLALSNLFALARNVGVGLFLPVAVERELEARYQRGYREVLERQRGTSTEVGRYLARIGVVQEEAAVSVPEAGVMEAYRTVVEAQKRSAGLNSVRLSARPANEYFDLLLHRHAPFSPDGRGFGDALICMSIIDDLLTCGAESAVIVTADRHFVGVAELGRRLGVRVDALTLEEAHAQMLKRLVATVGVQVGTAYLQLLGFLDAHPAEIRQVIENSLEIPESSLSSGFLETVENLERIESVAIDHVATSPELWRPEFKSGQRISLMISARVGFLVTVKTLGLAPIRRYRIGRPPAVGPKVDRPERLTRTIERRVEIEAKVTRTEESFADLLVESAVLAESSPMLKALIRARSERP